ncbi:MAG: hypothetical protein Q4B99_07115 [Clostridia bacterium]|nr:hypothetical protein [Clostridia bacterium]
MKKLFWIAAIAVVLSASALLSCSPGFIEPEALEEPAYVFMSLVSEGEAYRCDDADVVATLAEGYNSLQLAEAPEGVTAETSTLLRIDFYDATHALLGTYSIDRTGVCHYGGYDGPMFPIEGGIDYDYALEVYESLK